MDYHICQATKLLHWNMILIILYHFLEHLITDMQFSLDIFILNSFYNFMNFFVF